MCMDGVCVRRQLVLRCECECWRAVVQVRGVAAGQPCVQHCLRGATDGPMRVEQRLGFDVRLQRLNHFEFRQREAAAEHRVANHRRADALGEWTDTARCPHRSGSGEEASLAVPARIFDRSQRVEHNAADAARKITAREVQQCRLLRLRCVCASTVGQRHPTRDEVAAKRLRHVEQREIKTARQSAVKQNSTSHTDTSIDESVSQPAQGAAMRIGFQRSGRSASVWPCALVVPCQNPW